MKKKEKKRKKAEAIILVTATVVSVVAASILFLRFTKAGKRLTAKVAAAYIHGSVKYVSDSEVKKKPKPESGGGKNPGAGGGGGSVVLPEEGFPVGEIDGKKQIYHILLLGEEAIKSSPGKGRTDSILLVSIHAGQCKIHVTSILRDSYVEPEGMNPCKINAVYARQGAEGLYRIIYEKLGIVPDGYAKVGFDSFEELIDLLGGAQVTLTKEEADYLNSHNYISKEKYRNVREGTQVLNGNQTLGYCRVRYVANCNGTRNDYGRTERQRMVLKDLFERYKNAGFFQWISILKKGLGSVETDLDEKTMEELIYLLDEYHIREMEQHQLPAKGTFEDVDVKNNVTRTLVADWEENRRQFRNFLEKNK